MKFETRSGRPEDIPVVLDFARENYAFHDIPFDPEACRAALEELIRRPGLGRLLVGWVGAERVGYAVFAFCFSLEFHGREAFLDEVFIAEKHRARGLGGALLDAVEAEARSLGLRAIHLEVERANEVAKKTYASHGYADRNRFHLMSKELRDA